MTARRKRVTTEASRFHGVRWDKATWERLGQATRRLQARKSPIRITRADVIRIAVEAYCDQDEASEPTDLAS